ncbi:hypothetical protein F4777DRAFT_390127 [Nemania sp. FL0916]|nr:hypothetical protein F4777DRAFT_390127 [Nemania sp. FL0916]
MSNEQKPVAHVQAISDELTLYRPRRLQRYTATHALLLSWEDDDIGVAGEIEQLSEMLCDSNRFGCQVWSYQIPSQNPARALNFRLAQFLDEFGNEDNLIIVYYGGHGGPRVSTKGPCTWAAQINNTSAELDWSLIQPQLLTVRSDVLLLLDCCYAGQAARARPHRNFELLAATDGDQITPNGFGKWPSFTQILMKEMKSFLDQDNVITIPALHRRMVQHEAGLQRQPFYVCLSGEPGSIKLKKHEDTPAIKPFDSSLSSRLLQLQLSLSNDLDLTMMAARLVKWLTHDSPEFIENIDVVNRALTNVNKANGVGESVLSEPLINGATLFPYLSELDQEKAQKLLCNLRRSLIDINESQADTSGMWDIKSVVNSSTQLAMFVIDSLTQSKPDALRLRYLDMGLQFEIMKRRMLRRLATLEEKAPKDCLLCNLSYDPGSINGYFYLVYLMAEVSGEIFCFLLCATTPLESVWIYVCLNTAFLYMSALGRY